MIDKRIIGQESKTIKRIKRVKGIIDTILCIIIIPILIVNLTMVFKRIANPLQIPDFLGYKFFVILTGSMENTLNIGDFIVVKECASGDLMPGDIITFKRETADVTHRITKAEMKEDVLQYTTKGDNNNTEDAETVKIENIEGKYVFKIHKVGKIITFLQTTPGLIVLLIIPILIWLISFNINSYVTQKKMIRKTKRLKYDEERNEKKI